MKIVFGKIGFNVCQQLGLLFGMRSGFSESQISQLASKTRSQLESTHSALNALCISVCSSHCNAYICIQHIRINQTVCSNYVLLSGFLPFPCFPTFHPNPARSLLPHVAKCGSHDVSVKCRLSARKHTYILECT